MIIEYKIDNGFKADAPDDTMNSLLLTCGSLIKVNFPKPSGTKSIQSPSYKSCPSSEYLFPFPSSFPSLK